MMIPFFDMELEINRTFGHDVWEPVLSGLGLENCPYPSLSLFHHVFHSLGLKIETVFSESQSRMLRLTFKSLNLGADTLIQR